MAYTKDEWKRRNASRSDLSSHVVHLTRGANLGGVAKGPVEVLMKILTDGVIQGSEPRQAFIVGDRPAVCFQDAPLYSVAQNVYREDEYRRQNPGAFVRYTGAGLAFPKSYVYGRGGRPVIYDDTETAKRYLPRSEWWRIVRFDLSNDDAIIDWTHEREWRVPDEFEFDLRQVTVLLPNPNTRKAFIKLCQTRGQEDILLTIRGIVVLSQIFF